MNAGRWNIMLVAILLLAACTSRATPTASPEPTTTAVPPAAVPPTATSVPTPTPLPPAAPAPLVLPSVCAPQVSANTIINVRNGPTTDHSIIGSLQAGQTAQVDGKNAEGTWWYIRYGSAPNAHGWVAGSVTTSNCISGTVPVIDASTFPAPFVAAITNVEVSVDPTDVTVPGCVGESQKLTAYATIHASGPMQIQYSFDIEGAGTTKTKTLTFTEYGSEEVSETFRPEVVEGKHWVRLQIEGLNLGAWQYQAKYKISC